VPGADRAQALLQVALAPGHTGLYTPQPPHAGPVTGTLHREALAAHRKAPQKGAEGSPTPSDSTRSLRRWLQHVRRTTPITRRSSHPYLLWLWCCSTQQVPRVAGAAQWSQVLLLPADCTWHTVTYLAGGVPCIMCSVQAAAPHGTTWPNARPASRPGFHPPFAQCPPPPVFTRYPLPASQPPPPPPPLFTC
jgi:hypothetical protein